MSWKGPDKLDKLHQPKKLKKMGNKKDNAGSRRQFFSSLISKKETAKIKMLTPDGKLVEVDKDIVDASVNRQKASSQDIFKWMENPSKD